jgi:hypothetical protein
MDTGGVAVDRKGDTLDAEATFGGQLEIMHLKEDRQC